MKFKGAKITMFAKESRSFYSTSKHSLHRTPLYDCHIKLGAKMVPYAGFEMPVLYAGQSHIESHNWVRSKVGLFDVSHMLQHRIKGKNAAGLLQKVTPIDLTSLEPHSSSLSVLLNEKGGIIDDCIITKHDEESYYMVTNAGCREKDTAFIDEESKNFNDVEHSTFESTLLAVQGPQSALLLQKLSNLELNKLTFGTSAFTTFPSVLSSEVHIARCGYTGEDGFELSIPSSSASEIKEAQDFFMSLIEGNPDLVAPIGLAARDSLRLEAGMCLYGHELNESTTPIEASLTWLIPKTRRNEDAGFNGANEILAQIKDKSLVKSRRVGLVSKGPSPREGNKIFAEDGKTEVGFITSGAPSPTLGGNVAQGYVSKSLKIGSPAKIQIRGKLRDATLAKMPFVPNHFYRG